MYLGEVLSDFKHSRIDKEPKVVFLREGVEEIYTRGNIFYLDKKNLYITNEVTTDTVRFEDSNNFEIAKTIINSQRIKLTTHN